MHEGSPPGANLRLCIDFCLEKFNWAHFRCTKGAIRLHLLWDHDGYLPSFAIITEGKVSDAKVAHLLQFDPGTIVIDDRGYNDYGLFGKWTSPDGSILSLKWKKILSTK